MTFPITQEEDPSPVVVDVVIQIEISHPAFSSSVLWSLPCHPSATRSAKAWEFLPEIPFAQPLVCVRTLALAFIPLFGSRVLESFLY
jgi:hypothetical protein